MLDGISFEQSDVQEIDVGHKHVKIRVLAELSDQHEAYELGPPPSKKCFREILISFDAAKDIQRLFPGIPELDPEGGAHLGSLDTFERQGDRYRIGGRFGLL